MNFDNYKSTEQLEAEETGRKINEHIIAFRKLSDENPEEARKQAIDILTRAGIVETVDSEVQLTEHYQEK